MGNRPGSESRRSRVPTSGPGAASLGGAPDSPARRPPPGDDAPQVVHKPTQKFPMWTA
jgi:hypothetical protein